ncbi:MAG TPA: hypothetical protein PLN93_02035 [Vicinamibacterales bacterium]|nr:hypothetical protein [Vicinamibacterales bacterium]HPK70694.1 hypothetical protein [Vicinamibacterales bacterium]
MFRTAVNRTGRHAGLLAFVEKAIKEKGGALRYSTPGVTLLRECQGRVTAVIARAPDGSYVRLDALLLQPRRCRFGDEGDFMRTAGRALPRAAQRRLR